MNPPPEDDRNRGEDALTSAEAFVVPDDISALDGDIARWRRDEALRRRRARDRRFERLLPRRWRRYGVTTPMLIVTLLLVGALGAAMILLGPHGSPPKDHQAAQVLANPTTEPGRVGALLPLIDVTSVSGETVSLRSLRPALIALVPTGCDCRAAIEHLAAAATPYGVRQYVVTSDRTALQTIRAETTPAAAGFVDDGTLRALYGGVPDKPTVIVVGANGIVLRIEIGATSATTLNGDLDTAVSGRLFT
jgi:hypothetical protein